MVEAVRKDFLNTTTKSNTYAFKILDLNLNFNIVFKYWILCLNLRCDIMSWLPKSIWFKHENLCQSIKMEIDFTYMYMYIVRLGFKLHHVYSCLCDDHSMQLFQNATSTLSKILMVPMQCVGYC